MGMLIMMRQAENKKTSKINQKNIYMYKKRIHVHKVKPDIKTKKKSIKILQAKKPRRLKETSKIVAVGRY